MDGWRTDLRPYGFAAVPKQFDLNSRPRLSSQVGVDGSKAWICLDFEGLLAFSRGCVRSTTFGLRRYGLRYLRHLTSNLRSMEAHRAESHIILE